MTLAGTIQIELHHRAGKANIARITSSRPEKAAQVLLGKTPEQVLDIVPLLFTVCGNAQAYAALRACRIALGLDAEPVSDASRNMLVQIETLREHAWRILLDWPVFTGVVSDKHALTALFKFDAQFKRYLFRDGQAFKLDSHSDIDITQLIRLIDELEALIAACIFNGQLAGFRQLNTEAQLRDWLQQNESVAASLVNYLYDKGWAGAGQNSVACLPELESDTLNQQMRENDWAVLSRTPQWQGSCFETTALNRQWSQPLIIDLQNRYGNGLIVRVLSRLLEVSGILLRLKLGWASITSDQEELVVSAVVDNEVGLTQIQAARGLLIHRLALRQGKVSDYCIVAPTEWNFHPEGVVAQSLAQLEAENPSDLRKQAELLINAVDPCVQYALNLTDK